MNPRLVAVSGSVKGQSFPLTGDPIRVGRRSDNEICADDPFVSSAHCSVDRLPSGAFQVQDLNSRNGTFVNGTRITEVELKAGDEITLASGVSKLRYEP